MPAQPRKPAALKTVDVGGVSVSTDEIRSAIDILAAAKGIMVRQPLLKATHPLAEADYHAVADAERVMGLDAAMNTKPAFIAALQRLLG